MKPITDHNIIIDDTTTDIKLRPRSLSEFIGQEQLKLNLDVFIKAAKHRQEALDHVLFYGPPGLGKTTLSQIIAQELQVGFKITSGPLLLKTGDLAAILTNLKLYDVLFIDEIHRLPPAVEEILYSAMEEYSMDLIIGDGPAARTVKINLPQFTLIGATTRLGLLTNPLRDRFGIPIKLDFYSISELQNIIKRTADHFKVDISNETAEMLARCARGTPRIAVRLFRRIRDFAEYNNVPAITSTLLQKALHSLSIDNLGLDYLDHKYMQYLAHSCNGGPVGIETIAASIAEDKGTIEETVEPYLMQIGFLIKTNKGRILTTECLQYLRQGEMKFISNN